MEKQEYTIFIPGFLYQSQCVVQVDAINVSVNKKGSSKKESIYDNNKSAKELFFKRVDEKLYNEYYATINDIADNIPASKKLLGNKARVKYGCFYDIKTGDDHYLTVYPDKTVDFSSLDPNEHDGLFYFKTTNLDLIFEIHVDFYTAVPTESSGGKIEIKDKKNDFVKFLSKTYQYSPLKITEVKDVTYELGEWTDLYYDITKDLKGEFDLKLKDNVIVSSPNADGTYNYYIYNSLTQKYCFKGKFSPDIIKTYCYPLWSIWFADDSFKYDSRYYTFKNDTCIVKTANEPVKVAPFARPCDKNRAVRSQLSYFANLKNALDLNVNLLVDHGICQSNLKILTSDADFSWNPNLFDRDVALFLDENFWWGNGDKNNCTDYFEGLGHPCNADGDREEFDWRNYKDQFPGYLEAVCGNKKAKYSRPDFSDRVGNEKDSFDEQGDWKYKMSFKRPRLIQKALENFGSFIMAEFREDRRSFYSGPILKRTYNYIDTSKASYLYDQNVKLFFRNISKNNSYLFLVRALLKNNDVSAKDVAFITLMIRFIIGNLISVFEHSLNPDSSKRRFEFGDSVLLENFYQEINIDKLDRTKFSLDLSADASKTTLYWNSENDWRAGFIAIVMLYFFTIDYINSNITFKNKSPFKITPIIKMKDEKQGMFLGFYENKLVPINIDISNNLLYVNNDTDETLSWMSGEIEFTSPKDVLNSHTTYLTELNVISKLFNNELIYNGALYKGDYIFNMNYFSSYQKKYKLYCDGNLIGEGNFGKPIAFHVLKTKYSCALKIKYTDESLHYIKNMGLYKLDPSDNTLPTLLYTKHIKSKTFKKDIELIDEEHSKCFILPAVYVHGEQSESCFNRSYYGCYMPLHSYELVRLVYKVNENKLPIPNPFFSFACGNNQILYQEKVLKKE